MTSNLFNVKTCNLDTNVPCREEYTNVILEGGAQDAELAHFKQRKIILAIIQFYPASLASNLIIEAGML